VEHLRWEEMESLEITDVDVGAQTRLESTSIAETIEISSVRCLHPHGGLQRDPRATGSIAHPMREKHGRHRSIDE